MSPLEFLSSMLPGFPFRIDFDKLAIIKRLIFSE